MTDPTRLLDDTRASSATLELLRALEAPKAAPPAVRAALGNQLTALVTHGSAKAALGIGWVKAAALAVAVAGAGTGAVVSSLSTRSEPTTEPPPRSAVRHATSASSQTLAPPRTESPTTPLAPQAAPAVRERAAPSDREPVKAAEPRDKLAEEEAILEQARQTVRQDPSRALGLLRQHQARFAGGQLAAERMYLSVDCLRRLGQHDAARREADALIARYPTSAYARRAPQLLGSPAR